MNRLRAWDEYDKKMCLSPDNASNYELGTWLMAQSKHFLEKDSLIMQSIGKKDKNGKDIFVDDILATSNNNPECDIWDEKEHGFTVVEEHKEMGFCFSDWWVEEKNNSVFDIEYVKVVGNIHENPEMK